MTPGVNGPKTAFTLSKVQTNKKKDMHSTSLPKTIAKTAEPPKQKLGRSKKDVPEPKWVKVPTELDRAQAEDRFFVGQLILFLIPVVLI